MKLLSALTTLIFVFTLPGQDTTPPAQARPSEHVMGTVTALTLPTTR